MLGSILIGLQIIWAILSFILEKNSDKKKAKQAGLKEVIDGIEKGDPSAITAGFDTINNA